jgi:hypothetical protein
MGECVSSKGLVGGRGVGNLNTRQLNEALILTWAWSTRQLNEALILTWAWRLQDDIRCQLLKEKYFPDKPYVHRNRTKGSQFWNGVQKI